MRASPKPDLPTADPAKLAKADRAPGFAANDSGNAQPRVKSALNRHIGDARTALLAKRQAVVLQVLADFSSEESLENGLIAATNTIKNQLQCTRVSFGLTVKQRIRVVAISQQADVNACTAEAELLAAAMLEASRQDEMISLCASNLGDSRLQAHRLLLAGRPEHQIVSLAVCHEGKCLAVICLERESSISMSTLTLQLIRNVADTLAPLIAARRTSERSLYRHARDSLLSRTSTLVAIQHMKLKLSLISLLALILAASLIQVTYNIKAPAELVPLERRIISAPRDGYIRSVETGAGDNVTAGEVLLQLDTGELRVEQSRWNSELAGTATKFRTAMATRDRREMAILGAESSRLKAQLQLVETQLARSAIKAPVTGVIVSGELSQMVGAPVERGQTLMEIAPPEGYEVYLMVDEKDINRISVADKGYLSLKALSGEQLAFSVSAIHPIGIAEGGFNRFRVQANIERGDAILLPGQTGVGKIDVGSASVLWLMTHEFSDWFRQKYWEWLG
ncbi:efflux RND transporter periplasmic adaptor subunit [Granulosicoccus antarcticus]|uniref:CzcB-like barrel-sandwich hybrid domain-containing protein n=1 Tax=Granulosicoccus antarcticus IMCC3135 TaxID=1192854 RepID=A0A2Z2NKB3_9GAMM|nr:HlyD family efflux transporter periplasmic adaptor subunit [Granulosicoccus antarcticus]ASJ70945.1 hypothetical protein IMCC3135_04160 [Granulosicoccus antarcticus IMCC3135]